jgi:hypothetical protein
MRRPVSRCLDGLRTREWDLIARRDFRIGKGS